MGSTITVRTMKVDCSGIFGSAELRSAYVHMCKLFRYKSRSAWTAGSDVSNQSGRSPSRIKADCHA